MNKRVTLVVPVYADWSSLKECIASLKRHVNKRHKVMLVNDNGPQADELEVKIKKALAESSHFEYHRNSHNLGFLKTCNRAVFKLDNSGRDILLLNSDTKVTAGFLQEMQAVMESDPKIGCVSPRTNNATIATVPLSAMSNKGIEPTKSYEFFKKLKSRLPRYSEVPTAHGFCMLIRRSLIKKYGLFDEIFGMGYGEEVDFCMRIRADGYKNVLANHAYVFHLEARSFSPEQKNKMIEKSSRIILQRYPNYKRLVSDYITEALKREEGISPKKSIRNKLRKIGRRLRQD